MKKITTIFIIVVLSAGLHYSSNAQNAFSHLKITATGNGILGGNTILKDWTPTGGIGLNVSTPYYVGNFEIGARYNRYNELEFEGSGFHSTYLFAGWNYEHFVSEEKDLAIVPGIRFGSRYMIFDEEKTYRDEFRFSRFESEFSYEVNFRIQYTVSKKFEFYTSAAINQTRFKIPYAEWLGTIGVSYIFDTSEKLENFLK